MPDEASKKTPCDWCRTLLDEGATYCTTCKYVQRGPQCGICKAPIWPKAVRCNTCGSYRGVRRFLNFSTAVPTLLLVILGALWTAVLPLMTYYYERNSHTVIKVIGCDENQIYVKAWNTGRKPSALIRYRLMLDQMPGAKGQEATLELNDEQQRTQSVVEPKEKPVTLALSIPRTKDIHKPQYSPEAVKDYLAERGAWSIIPVTLTVDVQESNDEAGTSRPISDPILAEQIARFLPRLMP